MRKRKNPPRRRHKRYKKRGTKYRKALSKPVIDRMPGNGFADAMFVKLKYVDRVPISSVAVSYAPYVFRGNSVFDPDQSLGGHQPLYYDQYAAIYEKYRVIGSSIRLDVINTSGASALYYVCEPNTDVSTYTSVPQLLEQSRAYSPKIVPIAQRVPSRFTRYATTRGVLGLTKAQSMDDDYCSTVGANPTQQWFWNLLFQSMDGTTVVGAEMMVKIVYYVQFFERNLIVQS